MPERGPVSGDGGSDPAASPAAVVPVVHLGVLLVAGGGAGGLDIRVNDLPLPDPVFLGDSLLLPDPAASPPDLQIEVCRRGRHLPGSPLVVQRGGWSGRVDWQRGRLVAGQARNLRAPGQDVVVAAFAGAAVLAFATARASADGRFLLRLPSPGPAAACQVTLGIAGSDFLLEGGRLPVDAPRTTGLPTGGLPTGAATAPADPRSGGRIRIRISAPHLRDAPVWGDYHFARALAAALGRIGWQVLVDPVDAWQEAPDPRDVVIALRGRHRAPVDRRQINLMWLISHPDRVEPDEYADYDHIAVASDVYAAHLRRCGLPSVSVLHQATDAALFRADPGLPRRPGCLFVGNSRREYRQMVQWCVQSGLPLDLYGADWEGVVPPGLLRGSHIANADLPAQYAGALILLNDHWDSMRDNGFLSNRLFDGSATGTPILTDPVAGLADLFGDTIAVVDSAAALAAAVADCLARPEAWLRRAEAARAIVLAAHTFDHRARQITDLIAAVAERRLRRALPPDKAVPSA